MVQGRKGSLRREAVRCRTKMSDAEIECVAGTAVSWGKASPLAVLLNAVSPRRMTNKRVTELAMAAQ